MKLIDLLAKHQIKLADNVHIACQRGIDLMSDGTDPHHNDNHVYRIFDHLDYLLIATPKLRSLISFDILIPAICWHDVWISKHTAHNIFELIYFQLVEGRKSASSWLEYSSNLLELDHINNIHYCIRKHSSVQLVPPTTLEAKILIDLDKLEVWNINRFIKKENTLVSHKELYSKYIVRFYFQYSWYSGLYFRELDKILNTLRNNFWTELK